MQNANGPQDPLLIWDSREVWVVPPGDPLYSLFADRPKDAQGRIHVEPEEIAKVQTWWYPQADVRVQELLAGLEIDEQSIRMTDEEIDNGSLMLYAQKLARVAGYRDWVLTNLMRVDSRLSAREDALEHHLNRELARQENGQSPKLKGNQAARMALYISKDKRLRTAKIEIIELRAQKKALDWKLRALDNHWYTISRVISARAAEPEDRT